MAATYHHARRLYIGTTAEMAAAAVVLGVDSIGTKYWDTTVGVLYIWDGAAWVGGFSSTLLGEMLFTEADGLLLLGPDGEITPAEWWSQRKQRAILSGAFHQEAGRWQGTKGLVIEEATTNMVPNPSFEVDLAGWANYFTPVARTRVVGGVFGDWCQEVSVNGANDGAWYNPGFAAAINTDYVFTAYIRIESGTVSNARLRVNRQDGVILGTTGNLNITDEWKRYELAVTSDGGTTHLRPIVYNAGADVGVFQFDGAQVEQKSNYATSYCDGSLGVGYTWAGVAHASASSRTVTEASLDGLVSLVSSNNTVSFRIVAQMPYDYDATWSNVTWNQLFDVVGAGNPQRIFLYYDDVNEQFRVFINNANRLFSSIQAFDAGDWMDIVVTVDFTADDYNLYINGVLEDNDTTALASQILTAWSVGSLSTGANQAGANISEYAVFDRVLTTDEVAYLYALQRPLVDAGSLHAPPTILRDLYGYERFGGFRYWEGMVMAGGEVEVIPDAAGDVVYGMYAMCIATDRAGNTVQSTYPLDTPGAGSNTTGIFLAGGNSVVLRLYSTGRLTIDEIAGVGSIYVNLWLIWQ